MLLEPKSIAFPEFGPVAKGGMAGEKDPDDISMSRVSDTLAISPHRWRVGEAHSIDLPSHWSVPWSDLMMVMMVMFAVMYAAKLQEPDKVPSPKHEVVASKQTPSLPVQTRMEKIKPASITKEEILRLSEQLVQEANLGNIDVVLTDSDAIKVSVQGNLFFDLGMADLKPEAIAFLNHLAKIIAANNFKIEVSGHTDDFPISSPIYPTNWELSTARAARVARYLIQQGDVDPGRFTIIGHASYQPSLPNTTLSNKAKNRRVEITITREEYKS